MTEPDTNRSPKPLSGLTFDVTVEIPKGHKNKYEVDHGTGRIRLDRTLFTSTSYGRLRLHRGHPRSGRRPAGHACAGFGANLPGLPDSVPSHRYVRMRDEVGGDDKVLCVPRRTTGATTSATSAMSGTTCCWRSSTSSASTRTSSAESRWRVRPGPGSTMPRASFVRAEERHR